MNDVDIYLCGVICINNSKYFQRNAMKKNLELIESLNY